MRRFSWGPALLATLLYMVVFFAWTMPLGAHFASAFPAVPKRDAFIFLWNVWYFREAVGSGLNPFFTDWLLYPWGSSLVMHAYTPIIGLFNLLIGNEMLAVNLVMLASYALSGTGAYLLARRWVSNPVLCWLTGLIFAFSPYKMLRLPEHYNLVLTATVPFYIMAFLDAFGFQPGRFLPAVRSWRAVGWCFALGLLTLLSDYYVLFGLLYFSLAYAAWFWFRLGAITWRSWRPWAWLTGILIVSHVAIRLLRMTDLPDNGGFFWGGDVAGYLAPPATSRWLDFAWAARLYSNPKVYSMVDSLENVMFLGYALLVVGLVVAFWPQRAASVRRHDAAGQPLAWVLLFFVMLTLPSLRIFGKQRLNLPTSILHFIPFFNNIRCPTRWVMLVSLLLPVVTFSALEALWRPRLRVALQWAVSLFLVACVAVEYWPKDLPVAYAAQVPAVHVAAAQLPGKVLLPVPVGLLDGHRLLGIMQSENFFYQTRHRKKLPMAYFSRIDEARFAAFDQDTVMHTLLTLQSAPADTTFPVPTAAQALAFRRLLRSDMVVVQPQWRNGAAHRYLRQVFPDFGERSFPDGYVLMAPRRVLARLAAQ